MVVPCYMNLFSSLHSGYFSELELQKRKEIDELEYSLNHKDKKSSILLEAKKDQIRIQKYLYELAYNNKDVDKTNRFKIAIALLENEIKYLNNKISNNE